jgi:hypothetical protein
MAKKPALKNVEPEIDTTAARTIEVVTLLATSRTVAKKMFTTENPSTEMLFGVYDRLAVDGANEEEQAEDLWHMQDLCKEMFATPTPTPEMIFGAFDRIYLGEEDDGEEE